MRGQVLDYSVQTNSGIISGDDGNRYTFTGPEWKENRVPARGMHVDFEAVTGTEGAVEARGVYLAITPSASGFSEGTKTKVAAGVLAILLGSFGVHKFYLGYTRQGIMMLAGTIVGLILAMFGFVLAIVIIGIFLVIAIGVIGLVEGILYLTQSDEYFERIYVTGRKPWF